MFEIIFQAMEDFDQEGMDDDGGDDGADDMNDALEDMEEIDEYVHNLGSPNGPLQSRTGYNFNFQKWFDRKSKFLKNCDFF